MQYKQAYLDARREFSEKDPYLMTSLSGARCQDGKMITLSYLGRTCNVSYPQGEIQLSGWSDPPHEELILILQYLAGASGLPLRERWLSFLELPGGPHHFVPFQQEAILPLAKAFGDKPAIFLETAASLGGRETDLGHAGVIIPVLPNLPLAFILWTGDEEFPATANILFDTSAETYLPTASLYMLGIAAVKRLLATGK